MLGVPQLDLPREGRLLSGFASQGRCRGTSWDRPRELGRWCTRRHLKICCHALCPFLFPGDWPHAIVSSGICATCTLGRQEIWGSLVPGVAEIQPIIKPRPGEGAL